MASMNNTTRQKIIDVAARQGFSAQLKADGTDLYDKNLVFQCNRYPSRVFIDRETGIKKDSGDPNYLKVAVHPDHFRKEVIDPETGIEDNLNRRSKINLHASSNYVGFPVFNSNNEPCGQCYKVIDLIALEKLLKGLQSLP